MNLCNDSAAVYLNSSFLYVSELFLRWPAAYYSLLLMDIHLPPVLCISTSDIKLDFDGCAMRGRSQSG